TGATFDSGSQIEPVVIGSITNGESWTIISGPVTDSGAALNSTLGFSLTKQVTGSAFKITANYKTIPALDNSSYLSPAWNAAPAGLESSIRGLPAGSGDLAAQLVRQSMMPEQVATNLSASYHQSQAFSSTMRAYFKSRRLGQPGL